MLVIHFMCRFEQESAAEAEKIKSSPEDSNLSRP